jgi:hypothetical protein
MTTRLDHEGAGHDQLNAQPQHQNRLQIKWHVMF